MKIPELLKLIKELVKNKNLTKKEKISLASKIKKQYGITMRELKSSGKKISIESLRSLITPLIKNYDEVKNLNSINETMQTMIQDYDNTHITREKDKSNIETEKEKAYACILGNPGTTVDGMSSEYISKIIKRKLTEDKGINRDDIINLLDMQSKNMYLDIEEYQKLINDSVISFLNYNQQGEKFSNPKILDIFQSFASSYKVQGDYKKVRGIYEQALKIKSLKDTEEYNDLEKSYEKFLDFMEMKMNFEDQRFDSFDDLMDSMKVKFTQDDIFVKGTNNPYGQNPTPPPHSKYVMPIDKRLDGLKRLVNALKRENEDYDILECEVGKDAYEGYVIFKIENTNVSIFENFNEVNARFFAVKNEMIDSVKQLARNDAVALDGVEGANHIENFNNYCNNIIGKTKKLIRETQSDISPIKDKEIVFDESLLDISQDNKELPNVQDNENVEDRNGEKSHIEENEENQQLDEVEKERIKAHKNREELAKLEQELEIIKNNTNEKVANIRNLDDHLQE